MHAFQSQIARITKMYNGSLTLCTYPIKWKSAVIIPLAKVTNAKSVSDMRPISLLPLPGKIVEISISKRLKIYVDNNDILSNRQHGFRKKRSTLSAIVECLHDIYLNLNKHKDTYIVFLDLKKAFDTVSHKILLNKLKMVGLEQNSLNWLRSYLGDRQQRTLIDGNCSSELNVMYSVPQGSILGPTLFTIYINDLEPHVKSNINLYADDTIIYNTDPVILQNDLSEVYKWCNSNLLTVNCKKSQWMKTSIINKRADGQALTFGGMQLQQVDDYKYLGVNKDSGLNFQIYRDNLINRVNLKMIYFKKIRPFLTLYSALLVYKCTILPILEYADFVYDFDIKYLNKKLQTIQNSGLYIVFNQHYLPYDMKESTETLHRRAGIYRLDHRRKIHMLTFMYNYVDDMRLLDIRDINTRRREGILFKIYKIDHYKARQDPLLRAMEAWNNSEILVRNAASKEELKVVVRNSIVDLYKKME